MYALMKKLFVGQVGTTVSLHNLFHSLPVRYKEFQRNIKKVYNCFITHYLVLYPTTPPMKCLVNFDVKQRYKDVVSKPFF